MNAHQWLELALYLGALILVTKPLGLYLNRVLNANGRTWLDPVMQLEKLTYWIFRVDPAKEQGWKQYTFAMLIFSLVSCLFTYAILRLQQYLPLNPQHFGALSEHLAFNTAISFTTNTNWQSYGGESTMSYLSQMVALAIHNLGHAIAAALVRGIANFDLATDPNIDHVLTQLRYATAEPQLPPDVRNYGVTVQKSVSAPFMLLSVNSPGGTRGAEFLANYAYINLSDALLRVPGVSQCTIFGAGQYAMRIWVKPDQLAKLNITVPEIINAINSQNTVNPAGKIGGLPCPKARNSPIQSSRRDA